MKYLIIGAVAGGASTAARLRRMDEKARIIIFERGGYISYANCGLPYYIGDVIQDRNKLFVQTAASFQQRFNIEARVRTEVTAIDRVRKVVYARDCETGREYEESYDKLVLSPGAAPFRPALPGIQHEGIFTIRNVHDTDAMKAYIQHRQVRRSVVIGAGFIGVEMAENLHRLGVKVTIVEMAPQILPPLDPPAAAILQQHVRSKGVELILGSTVTGFEKESGGLKVSILNSEPVEADLVVLSVGVKPEVELAAKAGLKVGEAKGIVVNEHLQTSDPDIYAVGDAIEFTHPITGKSCATYLAGPANKQGRICANNIVFGNVQKFNGSIGTAIVKVFDMTAGVTGLSSKVLQKEHIAHLVSITHSGSHAGYYPGSKQMSVQLAFSPSSGRILGAQVVGYEGVDKRLDVVSALIQKEGSIYDLMEFEHSYAPPFSSAKDPLNMAGFVAENILTGRLRIIHGDALPVDDPMTLTVDVRTPAEFSRGNIPGAINIPLDDLRARMNELPKDRRIIIYCQIGLRGYLAQRILLQSGFENVHNLSGGYYLWKICADEATLYHGGEGRVSPCISTRGAFA